MKYRDILQSKDSRNNTCFSFTYGKLLEKELKKSRDNNKLLFKQEDTFYKNHTFSLMVCYTFLPGNKVKIILSDINQKRNTSYVYIFLSMEVAINYLKYVYPFPFILVDSKGNKEYIHR